MGILVRSSLRQVTSLLCAVVVFAGISSVRAFASGPAEPALDATALTELEQRAGAAEAKDRCYLYTELLHGWTELAGRDMAEGKDSDAASAIERADADAGKLKDTIARDSKRLKNAELLLEHTAHRLSDMVRVSSMDQHDNMKTVLAHLNSVHDEVLAQIFAH